ncbi:hemerythrin [Clostridium algifaecis]|uniref:Hemerythrin n=1 Tax=Clostridium algifaecis TaxID=1472040 RepID=A0ABS4KQA0_9CLOT|nr:hemerythrin family protein [Clostridium algifaecis]MBP2031760.1 hemerythrin [Clostridium algifaecis]
MFEWNDKYSCGIKKIDDEHKRLFEIGREIYNLVKDVNEMAYIDQILDAIDELKDYTVYHFEDEERIMLMYEYPGYKEQKLVHDKFIDKIENLDTDEIEKNPQEEVIKLLDFVYNWISEHILGMDFKIKDYVNNLKLSTLLKHSNKFVEDEKK